MHRFNFLLCWTHLHLLKSISGCASINLRWRRKRNFRQFDKEKFTFSSCLVSFVRPMLAGRPRDDADRTSFFRPCCVFLHPDQPTKTRTSRNQRSHSNCFVLLWNFPVELCAYWFLDPFSQFDSTIPFYWLSQERCESFCHRPESKVILQFSVQRMFRHRWSADDLVDRRINAEKNNNDRHVKVELFSAYSSFEFHDDVFRFNANIEVRWNA